MAAKRQGKTSMGKSAISFFFKDTSGCRTLSGLDMFVYQGAEQIRLWTGKEAPRALMRKVVLDHLAAAEKNI